MSGEDKTVYHHRGLPERSTQLDDLGWPSPATLPFYPPDEVGKALQPILERLDRTGKRLGNIEKRLVQRQPAP